MALNLLSRYIVEDLPPKSNNMICVKSTDTVPFVFKLLANSNILAAPVLNEDNRPIGLIDFVDIVCCVVQIINHTGLMGNDYHSFIEREDLLEHTYASHITDLSQRNPFIPVVQGASLLEAITVMAKNQLHRVPIVSNDMESGLGPKIINLVTQSAIVQFLAKHMDDLGIWSNRTLKDLGFVQKPVISINFHKRALEAFQLMAEKRVNGIAVVDDRNQLLANISARDLRELLNENRLFDDLYKSVGEFVTKVRQQDYRGVHPSICCSQEDTMRKLIMSMAAAKVHRVYMVDSDRRPTGVISLHDILLSLLDHVNSGTGCN
ncbi:hypothetical protein SAMD00019534_008250 [Acytostelium subglobosum LB1]|uniref:hypothetical protein n=1 Tax=Acytostelium subglobosum LB1 TaxID=1410327 RepID=UPI0006451169|nr:hypothetical protein SAMD00019534_008250 [Acytostelium subglobosum LB1]GAM17650.1 hypothetical protein SAMD00019534_008250 [Acytostelium subglobosum LB1]|eukprot:XP_012758246.1 hypothetical protein SAMD00019534_008250 [Acytostelium subglobosum LB1]